MANESDLKIGMSCPRVIVLPQKNANSWRKLIHQLIEDASCSHVSFRDEKKNCGLKIKMAYNCTSKTVNSCIGYPVLKEEKALDRKERKDMRHIAIDANQN